MKKLTSLLIAVAAAAMLVSCASMPKDYKEAAAVGSPDNSVLVYGYLYATSDLVFTQMNPEFEPDTNYAAFPISGGLFEPGNGYFVLKPVAPGSRYNLGYLYAQYQVGKTVYYVSNKGHLQGTVFDFTAPTKPGLYYYGAYDPFKSGNGTKGEYKTLFGTEKNIEITLLKKMAAAFKNTEWLPLIEDRMKEIKEGK